MGNIAGERPDPAPGALPLPPLVPPRRAHRSAANTAYADEAVAPAAEADSPPAATRSRGPLGRAITGVRLVHPFPSVLDGLVVAVVAMVAGAPPGRAGLLGLSTVAIQFAIGALNDLVDVRRDAGTRTGKPIAEGVVGERAAQVVIGVFAATGLALAWVAGPLLLAIAVIGLAIGVLYDVAANGTRLSWLPIALGVPLLPVYGWYGATGTLPSAFAVLVPAAMVAGAALAIANAAVDVERDVAAGSTSLAVALGPARAAALTVLLQALVAALAIASSNGSPRPGPWLGATVATAVLPIAGALLGLLRARAGPVAREVAFEVQAVGLGLLAVAWVNALSAATA